MTKTKREARYLIRFEATATNIIAMRKQLEAMSPGLAPRIVKIESGMSRADRLSFAMQDAADALSEVESLREEIEAWKDALPENLQSGSKADELDDCMSQLEATKDSLETAISESESVSFPGMY